LTLGRAVHLFEHRGACAGDRGFGGTRPENIAAAEHIEAVGKRIRDTPPILILDDDAAKGLIGEGSPKKSD
jgi:hypothetical protein